MLTIFTRKRKNINRKWRKFCNTQTYNKMDVLLKLEVCTLIAYTEKSTTATQSSSNQNFDLKL